MAENGGLTLGEVVSIGIGGMIGGGIFAVLGLSVQLTRGAAPIAFLIAGLIALLTAYSYAKLSKRFPSRGGTIEFLIKAYGTGIFSGTMNLFLLASYIVMISLYAYALGAYGAAFVGGDPLLRNILASLAIVIFTIINGYGAKLSGIAEEMMVGFKVAVLALIGIAGLALANWTRLSPSTWADPISLVAGGMIIFLAYEGFELIANTGSDIKDHHDLPKAFYISVASVMLIYVLIAVVTVGNLPLSEIVRYRDYALAAVATPIFGSIGFVLVALAAIVSTSSAINATLYGTARASYMVARYGQIPKFAEKKVWKNAYEGLIMISLISLIIVNTADLETISTAGSAGFLVIFLLVNIAAFKLRKEIDANPIIVGLATLGTGLALGVLIYTMYSNSPSQLGLLFSLLAGSAVLEVGYRSWTSRRLARYVDRNLMEKERNIRRWSVWVPGLVGHITDTFKDAEVYLVGNLARGSMQGVSSVDLVVFTENPPENRVESFAMSEYIKHKAGLGRNHPVRITYSEMRNKKKELEKYSNYKRVRSK